MAKTLLFLLAFLTCCLAQAQDRPVIQKDTTGFGQRFKDTLGMGSPRSTSNKGLKNLNAKIEQYKIISHENDTTIVDTSLTIKKAYKFNYLRKDNFDLLAFSNVGQTYNSLSYDFYSDLLMPQFGARARHFNYMEIEDINYYYVPTPFTELMYKSVLEQGQILDAFFTVNMSEQFNFSVAYKGLRSLGKYQHILTSTGNFRVTTNYKTKNNRYNARGHIVMQDLLNQENGGLRDEDLINFESGNPEFLDRSVFDPKFEDAESILVGKRFHLDHYYNIIQQKDSLSHNILSIGNKVSFEDKYYEYTQSNQNDFIGDAFENTIKERVTLEDFYAEINSVYNNSTIGLLKAFVGYRDYNYGYNKLVQIDGNLIPNRLKGNIVSVGGEYKNWIGKFLIHGKVALNVSGDFNGNNFYGSAAYRFSDDLNLEGSINLNSTAPNYNYLLYQSDYINYNWYNDFDNIQKKQLAFKMRSNKFLDVDFDYNTIDNYTYFQKNDEGNLRPNQTSATINYVRVKVGKTFKYKNFALENTIRYQNVIDGEGILNVPEFVTRNTLYYSNHFFKNALFIQTGITFSYFTEYNMNAYDPVLAEFYVQNETKIGNFPRLDFFLNAKVRQTRFYFKLEHFNSSFTGYNYYSAPNYPYRDFVVRFGLVWNFFL